MQVELATAVVTIIAKAAITPEYFLTHFSKPFTPPFLIFLWHHHYTTEK